MTMYGVKENGVTNTNLRSKITYRTVKLGLGYKYSTVYVENSCLT